MACTGGRLVHGARHASVDPVLTPSAVGPGVHRAQRIRTLIIWGKFRSDVITTDHGGRRIASRKAAALLHEQLPPAEFLAHSPCPAADPAEFEPRESSCAKARPTTSDGGCRSTDGGLTWSNPVNGVGFDGQGYDKPWIVCDGTSTSPHYGNCYSEIDSTSAGNAEIMSTSTDGGLTWSTGVKRRVPRAHGCIVEEWLDAGLPDWRIDGWTKAAAANPAADA